MNSMSDNGASATKVIYSVRVLWFDSTGSIMLWTVGYANDRFAHAIMQHAILAVAVTGSLSRGNFNETSLNS